MDRRQVYGGPSPPSISQVRSLCTRCTRGWPARGLFPCFFPGRCSYRRRARCEPPVAALVSDWGGEKLPLNVATASVGSRWRSKLPKALATANGGSSSTGVREWCGATA